MTFTEQDTFAMHLI